MKHRFTQATKLGAVVMSFSLTLAVGHADESGFYVTTDFGRAFTGDTHFKADLVPGGVNASGDVKFQPGGRLSVGAGYRFNEWLSAGAESGFIISEAENVDAVFYQVPFLADVQFRLPNRSPIEPFIGGGAGFTISTLEVYKRQDVFFGNVVDDTMSDSVFAWQAYAGLRYRISKKISVGVIYKYFGADSPKFNPGDGGTGDIRFDKVRTQSISASFNANF